MYFGENGNVSMFVDFLSAFSYLPLGLIWSRVSDISGSLTSVASVLWSYVVVIYYS